MIRTINLLTHRFKRKLSPRMSQFAVRLRRDDCQIMTASKHDETLTISRNQQMPINYPSFRVSPVTLFSVVEFFDILSFATDAILQIVIHERNIFDISHHRIQ